MKQQFYVYQTKFIKPIINGISNTKINVNRLIAESDLKYFDLSKDDNYLPARAVYDFLFKTKRALGSKNFLPFFLSGIKLNEIRLFKEIFIKCPTLFKALKYLLSNNNYLQTNIKYNLEIYNQNIRLTFYHLDKTSRGREIAESIELAIILNLFRKYGKGENKLLSLGVPFNSLGTIEKALPGHPIVIRLNRPLFELTFYDQNLIKEIQKIDLENIKQNRLACQDSSQAVKKVLRSFKNGKIPSLPIVARLFNTSESTLKRILQENDIKFSDLINEQLYKRAKILLINSDLNVNLISEQIGYSDSPNFIRSFKRWSGLTPNQFRFQHKL